MVDQNTDFFQVVDNFAKTAHIPSIPIIECKLDFIPKITIAIPTYKRPELLKVALDSAINQTGFTEYEIIVVDNNPERNCATERLLKTYSDKRLSYYKNIENIGMFGNWNRCIELARGEYFTNLNDDDTLSEEYLKLVIEVISKNAKIDSIVVAYQVIDSEGKIISEKKKLKSKTSKIIALDLFFGNINPGSLGILFSKKTLLNIGGYDETYYPSSDYIFLVKYLANFENVFYLNKILTNYRMAVNESNNTTTLQGFIDVDKKIRNTFISIYPKLKKLIELSLPILELKQYKGHCQVSNEFNEINSNQINALSNKISSKNVIAYNLLFILRKLFGFKRIF